ncbi:MAG: pilus assembly protein [Zoogloeaceae bacterium]|nr:pilus assembly protein [Rhodocyclaceae bacterium]MCP5234912.1 pilus assembly protein [Zoogloeaceae bacterium]
MAPDRLNKRCQRGAAATEFALVSIVFMGLVIGVIELGRLAYVYTTAVEATRLGARIAVVCSQADDTVVKAKMKAMLPLLEAGNISIVYPAATCSITDCDPVTVSIQNLTFRAVIPLVPLDFQIPAYTTSLPAESLDSTDNDLCT